jgi:hypothetical protein
MLGRKTVLGEEVESLSVNHILITEAKFCGLTPPDLRCMAYQLAKRNNIHYAALAGRAWLDLFLKRHTELSVRKPTGTSFARSCGFNKESC